MIAYEWVHILRESREFSRRGDDGAKFLHLKLQSLHRRAYETKKLGKGGKQLARVMERELLELLTEAPSSKWTKKLARASGDLFTCVEFREVPMDNNHAERCLREVVLHRKIKGHITDRSLLVLLGFLLTCKLRQLNLRSELATVLGIGG